MKYILIVLLITGLYNSSAAQTKDSVSVEEFRRLEAKVNILNETNDRTLNALYFSITSMLALVIGLSIYNAVKSYQLDKSVLVKEIEKAKKELSEFQNKLIETIVDGKLGQTKESIRLLKDKIYYINKNNLISLIPQHPYRNIHEQMPLDNIISLIELHIAENDTSYLEPALQALKVYLTEYKDSVYYSEKPKLLSLMDNPIFKKDKLIYQVNDLKTIIQSLK